MNSIYTPAYRLSSLLPLLLPIFLFTSCQKNDLDKLEESYLKLRSTSQFGKVVPFDYFACFPDSNELCVVSRKGISWYDKRSGNLINEIKIDIEDFEISGEDTIFTTFKDIYRLSPSHHTITNLVTAPIPINKFKIVSGNGLIIFATDVWSGRREFYYFNFISSELKLLCDHSDIINQKFWPRNFFGFFQDDKLKIWVQNTSASDDKNYIHLFDFEKLEIEKTINYSPTYLHYEMEMLYFDQLKNELMLKYTHDKFYHLAVWNLENGNELRKWRRTSRYEKSHFAFNSNYIATAHKDERLFEISTWQTSQPFTTITPNEKINIFSRLYISNSWLFHFYEFYKPNAFVYNHSGIKKYELIANVEIAKILFANEEEIFILNNDDQIERFQL